MAQETVDGVDRVDRVVASMARAAMTVSSTGDRAE
jgi:hypothetical protein